jgi:hypothetical protein
VQSFSDKGNPGAGAPAMVGLGPAGWSLLRELLLRCFLGGSFCAALLSFSLLLGGLLRFVAAGGAGGARWVGILGLVFIRRAGANGVRGLRSEGSDGPALNDAVPRGI